MASLITVDTADDTFPLTRSLFWDTNVETLDWEWNAPFIVERVLQRGTVEDFEDAEADGEPLVFDKAVNWELVKNPIREAVATL